MTAAEVRVPHAQLIVVVAAGIGCAAILWLARTYTFYFDEWTFILTAPDWTLITYFQPHTEHPSIFFRIVYAALLHTFSLPTYLPYIFFLLRAPFPTWSCPFPWVAARPGAWSARPPAASLSF